MNVAKYLCTKTITLVDYVQVKAACTFEHENRQFLDKTNAKPTQKLIGSSLRDLSTEASP